MVQPIRLTVTKEFTFDSCHNLPNHDGKCRNKHGHTYRLLVTLTGQIIRELDKPDVGMVMDFSKLKSIVNENIIDLFDHNDLNNIYPNPTAEVMAFDIYQRLSKVINTKDIKVWAVTLYETPDSFAKVEGIN